MPPEERPLTAEPIAHVPPLVGTEWVVDAFGCDPGRLRTLGVLRTLCDRALAELELHPVGPGLWHPFPEPGGVTGLYLLTESHLACHTYPEHGLATFNLYCCRPRPQWEWEQHLGQHLGATHVTVRTIPRGHALPSPLEGEGGERSEPGEGNSSNPSPHPQPLSLKGRGATDPTPTEEAR